MAGYVNKATLMGNVGRDPEVKDINGMQMASLSVATSESWKDKTTGEWQNKTEWHRIVILNDRIIEHVIPKIAKGMRVYLEGKIQTRKWTAKDGTEKQQTEIVIDRFQGTIIVIDKVNESEPTVKYDTPTDGNDIPF